MRRIYIGIGSNLGDRQGNILSALQRIRTKARVLATSAMYETQPSGGAEGPAFINAAALLETSLSADEFASFAQDVQHLLGRTTMRKLSARPIDIDILAVDGKVVQNDLATRPFNLIPLSEIATDLQLPAASSNGVQKKLRALQFDANRQEEAPEVALGINRAGVWNVRRIIPLEIDGSVRPYHAQVAMVADLAPDKAGVHMSRFNEILEETTLDVLAEAGPARIEQLAQAIAHAIIDSQRATSADVRLRADFSLERWTPVSGKRGEETYTLIGIAHADASGSRCIVGVEAEGMTACPCAQLMVREHSVHELRDAGFSESDAQRALDALPVATHNQRGRGSVLVGLQNPREQIIRAEDLVELVENSMSSETYDLLKRPDEFFIVNKAHHNPKFVEDVVRGILWRTLQIYADFSDDAFLAASQLNFESIHKHDAFAEAFGTFGQFRAELRGERTLKTDAATWLGTRSSPVIP